MTTIRLTRRDRQIRTAIITVAVMLLVWRLNDMTTPDVCKVAVEHMSGACKRLLFP